MTALGKMTYKQLTDEMHITQMNINLLPKGKYRNDMIRHYYKVMKAIKRKQKVTS